MTDVPEMVERVARALCEASGGHWTDGHGRTDTRNAWRHAARAAIEAMREPTAAMLRQVDNPGDPIDGSGAMDATEAEYLWGAMINAALGKKSA